MTPSGEGLYDVTLMLAPGVYMYHFLVDGKERFAPDQPTQIVGR